MASSNKTASITRRTALGGLSAAAGTAFFATAPGSSLITVANAADGTAKISMQLGWLASNGICGEVCAKRLGYYDELGIELEVIPKQEKIHL